MDNEWIRFSLNPHDPTQDELIDTIGGVEGKTDYDLPIENTTDDKRILNATVSFMLELYRANFRSHRCKYRITLIDGV